jgi:hypothetical protein
MALIDGLTGTRLRFATGAAGHARFFSRLRQRRRQFRAGMTASRYAKRTNAAIDPTIAASSQMVSHHQTSPAAPTYSFAVSCQHNRFC